MQDPEHNPYETGYDAPTLPYVSADPTLYQEPARPAPPVSGEQWYAGTAAGGYSAGPITPSPDLPLPDFKPVRRRRRRLWIVLAGVVALLIIVPLVAYQVVSYLNRSTPTKTLDTFCNALLHDDYHGAYTQFSTRIQSQFNESTFTNDIAQDRITSCSHGNASDSGSSATTNLKLVHSSKGINNDLAVLTKDGSNNWKISDLRKQA